jgi:DNA-binding XRE family transcriptional regulator
MSRIQIIKKDGKPLFAVVPIDIWERVRGTIEDAEDIADLERFDLEDDGVRVPAAVAFALAAGVHAGRAWREHRGLTQETLSEAAGISKPYLSQIEGHKRTGTTKVLSAIAKALDVPLSVLAE